MYEVQYSNVCLSVCACVAFAYMSVLASQSVTGDVTNALSTSRSLNDLETHQSRSSQQLHSPQLWSYNNASSSTSCCGSDSSVIFSVSTEHFRAVRLDTSSTLTSSISANSSFESDIMTTQSVASTTLQSLGSNRQSLGSTGQALGSAGESLGFTRQLLGSSCLRSSQPVVDLTEPSVATNIDRVDSSSGVILRSSYQQPQLRMTNSDVEVFADFPVTATTTTQQLNPTQLPPPLPPKTSVVSHFCSSLCRYSSSSSSNSSNSSGSIGSCCPYQLHSPSPCSL